MKKRVISMFIAVAMMFTMIPTVTALSLVRCWMCNATGSTNDDVIFITTRGLCRPCIEIKCCPCIRGLAVHGVPCNCMKGLCECDCGLCPTEHICEPDCDCTQPCCTEGTCTTCTPVCGLCSKIIMSFCVAEVHCADCWNCSCDEHDCELQCICAICDCNCTDCLQPNHKLGHVLGNADITIADVLEILKYIVGLDSIIYKCDNAFNAARVTGGEVPTTADALEILKYIVGIEGVLNPVANGIFRTAAEVENMSDKRLISEAQKIGKVDTFPVGFYVPSDLGVALLPPVNSSPQQLWTTALKSAASEQQARQLANEYAASRPNQISNEVTYVGECEYFYAYNVTWSRRSSPHNAVFNYRFLVYKSEVLFLDVTANPAYIIHGITKQRVADLSDLMTFMLYDNASYYKRVIYREVTETADLYVYTAFVVSYNAGDWGLDAGAGLQKLEMRFDKTTGARVHSEAPDEFLKWVTIPNSAVDPWDSRGG